MTEPSKVTIYKLIKIVEKENYAQDFLAGKLHMNPLSYFQKCEEEESLLRGDPDEGVASIFQPKKIQIKIADHIVDSADLVGAVKMSYNATSHLNAFCMYSLNNGEMLKIDGSNLDVLKNRLLIPKSCYGFGDVCIVVHNVEEFIERAQEGIRNTNCRGTLGLVKYYDSNEVHGNFKEKEIPFQKNNIFSDQREYRIVVDRNAASSASYVLEIGDLSDICSVTTPEEFNKNLKIALPDGSEA